MTAPRPAPRPAPILAAALCVLSLAAAPARAEQDFGTYGSFTDFTTWTLLGSASATTFAPGNGFVYSTLTLTDTGVGDQAGAGWAPEALSLDFNQAFSASFPFFIAEGSVVRGDGIVLVLAATPGLGNGGSDLGYNGLGASVAFAIDTFHFDGEPVSPSLQILQGGNVTPLAATETGLGDDIRDPALQWVATLSYAPSGLDDNAGTLTGTIWRPDLGSFSVSAGIDFAAEGLAGSPVHWGFTGGNGLADDGQYITSAMPVPEPGAWALLAAGLGAVGFVTRRRR
ncbi:PEP-CTERM sorting domain-containing protein [Rubrivivax albus]|uniref:PEP-CTERM sorting domain-containing protein n=1 Tax=Rubrivivax albus TaxID=2499835 RepID=A0A437JXZ7_9BURK|nr:PEP-CTERM sorting domain-containing protein [Rubrivivax albus]RVT52542.1 PEP-CTERM sorting domain-containing protein [Rubrivivax albus]